MTGHGRVNWKAHFRKCCIHSSEFHRNSMSITRISTPSGFSTVAVTHSANNTRADKNMVTRHRYTIHSSIQERLGEDFPRRPCDDFLFQYTQLYHAGEGIEDSHVDKKTNDDVWYCMGPQFRLAPYYWDKSPSSDLPVSPPIPVVSRSPASPHSDCMGSGVQFLSYFTANLYHYPY